MAAKKWYVYENLNDRSDRLVLSEDKVVAGIYAIIGGPFDSKEEAKKFLKRKQGK